MIVFDDRNVIDLSRWTSNCVWSSLFDARHVFAMPQMRQRLLTDGLCQNARMKRRSTKTHLPNAKQPLMQLPLNFLQLTGQVLTALRPSVTRQFRSQGSDISRFVPDTSDRRESEIRNSGIGM